MICHTATQKINHFIASHWDILMELKISTNGCLPWTRHSICESNQCNPECTVKMLLTIETDVILMELYSSSSLQENPHGMAIEFETE